MAPLTALYAIRTGSARLDPKQMKKAKPATRANSGALKTRAEHAEQMFSFVIPVEILFDCMVYPRP
jgi:hypothetical protein